MDRIKLLQLFILIGIFSCSIDKKTIVDDKIDEIKQNYAPDARVAIFNINASDDNPINLTGETNLYAAKEELISALTKLNIEIEDQIKILPDESIDNKKFALINVSVANLRGKPTHSAELVTQALLGTPVNILKENNGWYLVQTPDNYISWTNSGSLLRLDQNELKQWKANSKIIFLDTYGFSYHRESEKRISDLVAGNVLELENENNTDWFVRYPDGRLARIIKAQASKITLWNDNINITDTSITEAAMSLIGVPYLWGGTSTKGLDCSGFTKTIYMLHGYIIPRDASQQVHQGELIDAKRNFSRLKTGDLLFFGRKDEGGSEKVVHVGLWLGNNQFIHASGDVHISSMDSTADNYDSYNYNRYLRTKRIISENSGLDNIMQQVYGYYKK